MALVVVCVALYVWYIIVGQCQAANVVLITM